jgi:hypothetical protein
MAFHVAISKWQAVKLFAIGLAVGILFVEVFQVRPILDGWKLTIDEWQKTLDLLSDVTGSLRDCVAACGAPANHTGWSEPFFISET